MRKILARGNGVALAELTDDDTAAVRDGSDGAFDVDRDDRPMPFTFPIHGAAVTTGDGGEVLGVVSWHAVNYGAGYGCLAWNIGGELLRSARGRGVGTEMWRLTALHLLATTDIDRVEASTDVENVATQRSLEKAGFTREGVIRGAQLREGTRHDLVGYSLLRSDVTDEKLTPGQNG
jgi:RimJ/RimL family protein N-acetyltransferase